jgi:hypothetical protein
MLDLFLRKFQKNLNMSAKKKFFSVLYGSLIGPSFPWPFHISLPFGNKFKLHFNANFGSLFWSFTESILLSFVCNLVFLFFYIYETSTVA